MPLVALEVSLARLMKRFCSVLEGSDPCPLCFTRATVELFGHMTVTCLSLQDNAASMFMCLCKHMNVAMDTVTASSGGCGKQQVICSCTYQFHAPTDEQVAASECCYEFLHFLETLVHRLFSIMEIELLWTFLLSRIAPIIWELF